MPAFCGPDHNAPEFRIPGDSCCLSSSLMAPSPLVSCITMGSSAVSYLYQIPGPLPQGRYGGGGAQSNLTPAQAESQPLGLVPPGHQATVGASVQVAS